MPANTELFGHRFRIKADVDGDGLADTLTEVYHSRSLGREVAKYIQDMPYDSLVARTYDLQALVLIRHSNGHVDTLSDRGSGFGLALLVNEGDLDGDGGDEIGYVLDNADWSNTNTYRVATWKKGGMLVMFTFPIWDWQLPDLPDTEREYGLIGQTGRKVHAPMDSMPVVDLVIPLRPGAAMVMGNVGDATLDTMEVRFAEGDSVRYIRPVVGP
ncbi:MAG: hypothetical protein JNL52_13350 [Flavobacteriales bacterium]|nr:hypothetical protein [Flavobacteriales bacterium]